MTDHTSPAPQILKCEGTADFLAALPWLAGFVAKNSIFVLFFEGSRTKEAMRVDLPIDDSPRETADLLEFLSYTVRSFASSHGATAAPAIAIMTDQTFAESNGAPWTRLARRIERRLSRDRVRPRELCVRAPDGWVSYLDPRAPRSGRSLVEIERSPITQSAKLTRQEVPTLEELGALPEPDQARIAAARDEFERATATGLRVPSSRAAQSLRESTTAFSPAASAQLAAAVGEAMGWWHVAMGALTRPEFPGELEQELGVAGELNIPVDAVSISGQQQSSSPAANAGCTMYSLLAAVCPEFTDRERLVTIRQNLVRALADVPDTLRPGLFALSALIWWVSGNQTTAFQHVDDALEIEPDHEVATMVRKLIQVPLAARQMLLPSPSRALPTPRAAVS